MIDGLAAYHPDLAAFGVAVAGAALLADRALTHRVGRVLASDVAPLLGGAALGATGQLPWPVVIAVAVAVIARHLPTSEHTTRPQPAAAGLLLLAVGLAATARSGQTAAATTMLVAAAGSALLLPSRSGGAASRGAAVLLAAALGGTFLAGPDTEAAVLLGAALPLAIAGSAHHPIERTGRALWPSVVLVAFVVVDAYRGRPAGLPAALVAEAALVGGALVAVVSSAERRWWLALLGVALLPAVAARSIGLDWSSSAGHWGSAAALAAAVLLGTELLSRAVDGSPEAGPAPRRRHPG